MRLQLVLECAGRRVAYPLSEGTVIVGRDRACDICFLEPSLSRRHLMCTLRGDDVFVRDLNTRNGTHLGPQRIEEAHLRPGVRLRAGNCFLFIEEEPPAHWESPAEDTSDAASQPHAPTPPPPPDDLEALVPDAPGFHAEEEPTPAEDLAQAPPGDKSGGTRLIVRDGRWYAQDAGTGVEVEIVPVQQSGRAAGPRALPAPGGDSTVLPSRILASTAVAAAATVAAPAAEPGRLARLWSNPRRRMQILIATAAALVVIVAAAILLRPAPPPPPTSRTEYIQTITAAQKLFESGDGLQALATLNALMKKPLSGRPRLAELLHNAISADLEARKQFATGWEKAETLWEELRDFSETSDDLRDIARKQLEWYREEAAHLASLNDARRLLHGGQYAQVLSVAARIPAESMFRAEADPLREEARGMLIKQFLAKADQAEKAQQWAEAVRHIQSSLAYAPESKEALQARIAALQVHEQHRVILEDAQKLMAAGQFAEATQRLKPIEAGSVYADKADTLRKQCHMQAATQQALLYYNGGKADDALKILTDVGLQNTSLFLKIRQVLDTRAKAFEAMQAQKFNEVENAWSTITRLENDAKNYYLQEAQNEMKLLPERKRQMAQQLAGEGEAHIERREYKLANQKFHQSLLLDAENAGAREGLKKLARQAEYLRNMGLNIKRESPERAMKLLLEARDCLRPTDEIYLQLDREIESLRTQIAAPPAL